MNLLLSGQSVLSGLLVAIRGVLAVGTLTKTIDRQAKQVVGGVADAVLITHAVVLVTVLAVIVFETNTVSQWTVVIVLDIL